MIKSVTARLAHLKKTPDVNYFDSEALYNQGSCQVLSQSVNLFDVLVNEGDEDADLYRCLYCQY